MDYIERQIHGHMPEGFLSIKPDDWREAAHETGPCRFCENTPRTRKRYYCSMSCVCESCLQSDHNLNATADQELIFTKERSFFDQFYSQLTGWQRQLL